jgi:negative regulator of flagellin synthesis FlgM
MSIEKIGSSLQTTPSSKATKQAHEAAPDGKKQPINNESLNFNATDTAKKLKHALAATGSEPVIDTARIEAVKQQLESGTYIIDAEKIAAKIIESENHFSSPG